MDINAEILLAAYAQGYFPMAEDEHASELHWFNPKERGLLRLCAFHIPRSLQKFLRRTSFFVTFNQNFSGVIQACAKARGAKRKSTWINAEIIALYTELHQKGHAHSVEVWDANTQQLIGGMYGVSIGGAFFGESMFSAQTNASKMALVHLVERLRSCGYTLLDAQFENPHLAQFGFEVMAQKDYLALLRGALNISPNPSSRFLTLSENKS